MIGVVSTVLAAHQHFFIMSGVPLFACLPMHQGKARKNGQHVRSVRFFHVSNLQYGDPSLPLPSPPQQEALADLVDQLCVYACSANQAWNSVRQESSCAICAVCVSVSVQIA